MYKQLYRRGEKNFCPGCGQTSWEVGRTSAECVNNRCGTALELEDYVADGVTKFTSHDFHIPANIRGRFVVNGRF